MLIIIIILCEKCCQNEIDLLLTLQTSMGTFSSFHTIILEIKCFFVEHKNI